MRRLGSTAVVAVEIRGSRKWTEALVERDMLWKLCWWVIDVLYNLF